MAYLAEEDIAKHDAYEAIHSFQRSPLVVPSKTFLHPVDVAKRASLEQTAQDRSAAKDILKEGWALLLSNGSNIPAIIAYPDKAAGFTVSTLNETHEETRLAIQQSLWVAMSAGIARLRNDCPDQGSESPIDPKMMTRIASWIGRGKWFAVTLDEGRVAVTLNSYERIESYVYTCSDTLFPNITGAEKVLRVVRLRKQGYGETVWEAFQNAFNASYVGI